MTLAVRLAGLDDAAAMSLLHAACFDAGWSQDAFEGLFADPHITGWVAQPEAAQPEAIAGGEGKGSRPAALEAMVLIRTVLDEAEILTLAVAPGARRHGLARRAVETAIVAVAALGASGLFLEVAASNEAARALYRSLGFEEVARRKAYYRKAGGGREDALVLSLTFPVLPPAG